MRPRCAPAPDRQPAPRLPAVPSGPVGARLRAGRHPTWIELTPAGRSSSVVCGCPRIRPSRRRSRNSRPKTARLSPAYSTRRPATASTPLARATAPLALYWRPGTAIVEPANPRHLGPRGPDATWPSNHGTLPKAAAPLPVLGPRAALRSGRVALDELRPVGAGKGAGRGGTGTSRVAAASHLTFRSGRSASLRCSQRRSPGKPTMDQDIRQLRRLQPLQRRHRCR